MHECGSFVIDNWTVVRWGLANNHNDTDGPHLPLEGTVAIMDEDPAYSPPWDHQVLAKPTAGQHRDVLGQRGNRVKLVTLKHLYVCDILIVSLKWPIKSLELELTIPA